MVDSRTSTQVAWRKARLLWHIVKGLTFAACLLPWFSDTRRIALIQHWAQKLLAICVVPLKVESQGAERVGQHPVMPDLAGVMLLANHVSWLDIYAINAWHPVRFVAKSEIRRWPVVGWLAAQTGTIFIERESRRDAKRIMHSLAEHLQQGHTICVFPEGTTTEGNTLLPFHANLLQAPVSAKAQVLPVALRYEDARTGELSLAPAYAGETSLVDCLNAILRTRHLQVRLTIGQPLDAAEFERRGLAQAAHGQIRELLNLPAEQSTAT